MLPEINTDKPQGSFETKFGPVYYQINSREDVFCTTSPPSERGYCKVGQISVYLNVHFTRNENGEFTYSRYPNRPYASREIGFEDVPSKTIDKLCIAMLSGFLAGKHADEFRLAEDIILYEKAVAAIEDLTAKREQLAEAEKTAEHALAAWENCWLALSL